MPSITGKKIQLPQSPVRYGYLYTRTQSVLSIASLVSSAWTACKSLVLRRQIERDGGRGRCHRREKVNLRRRAYDTHPPLDRVFCCMPDLTAVHNTVQTRDERYPCSCCMCIYMLRYFFVVLIFVRRDQPTPVDGGIFFTSCLSPTETCRLADVDTRDERQDKTTSAHTPARTRTFMCNSLLPAAAPLLCRTVYTCLSASNRNVNL